VKVRVLDITIYEPSKNPHFLQEGSTWHGRRVQACGVISVRGEDRPFIEADGRTTVFWDIPFSYTVWNKDLDFNS
jgi:hypothetical protein